MELRVVDVQDQQELLEQFLQQNETTDNQIEQVVSDILARVKGEGDRALLELTERFDGVDLNHIGLEVSPQEIDEAYCQVDKGFLAALRSAKERITMFHQKQVRQSWFAPEDNGTVLGQLIRPVGRVGLYAPGGRAVYPSSVLMGAIPAKLAGVQQLILCTPPNREGKIHPQLLVAARETGVDRVFRCGGAQGIGALAYGTETIPSVDTIVGPGNIYVATAKKQVYGQVDIDSVAGPSEVAIIADSTARPDWVAADLIAQGEHDPQAVAILITSDPNLVSAVSEQLDIQLAGFERRAIALQALQDKGIVFVVKDLQEAAAVSNRIAPEHLQVMVEDPWSLLGEITSAGAVFLGHYAAVALGDYSAGTNHVLPTGGTARFFSALSVDHFIKRINLAAVSSQGVKEFGPSTITLARGEGLPGHARSVELRLKEGKEKS